MANSNSNLNSHLCDSTRDSLSFLASIATSGHESGNLAVTTSSHLFPSSSSNEVNTTCHQQQLLAVQPKLLQGTSVTTQSMSSAHNANNSAAICGYQVNASPQAMYSNSVIATMPASTSSNFLNAGNQMSHSENLGHYFMSSGLLSYPQTAAIVDQSVTSNSAVCVYGNGTTVPVQLAVAPLQQPFTLHPSFPVQPSPLQVPSPVRHSTLLQHPHVTSLQQVSLPGIQANATHQTLVIQQQPFLQQPSLSQQPSSIQKTSMQQVLAPQPLSLQQPSPSQHASPLQQSPPLQMPSPLQQPSPLQPHSPLEHPSSSLSQASTLQCPSPILSHTPSHQQHLFHTQQHQQQISQSANTSVTASIAASSGTHTSINSTSSSAGSEAHITNTGGNNIIGAVNFTSNISNDSSLHLSSRNVSMDICINDSPCAVSTTTATITTTTNNSHGDIDNGKSSSMTTSDAKQCTEMFSTICEALSVADNTEVTSATSVYTDEPVYMPPVVHQSEGPSNQLMSFNFLTTCPHQLTCRHCGYSTDFHMVFTRHIVCHFMDKGFACPLCVMVCSSEFHLKQHVADHLDGMSGNSKATKMLSYDSDISKNGNVCNMSKGGGSVTGCGDGGSDGGGDGACSKQRDSPSKVVGNFSKGQQQLEKKKGNKIAQYKLNSFSKFLTGVSPQKVKNGKVKVSKGKKMKKMFKNFNKSNSKTCNISKSKKNKRKGATNMDSEDTDNYHSNSDGSYYSINRYGPISSTTFMSSDGFNKTADSSSIGKQCDSDSFAAKGELNEADYDLYNPIDPIATTNRTLSYADFYKKHSFMTTTSSVKSDEYVYNSSNTNIYNNANNNNISNNTTCAMNNSISNNGNSNFVVNISNSGSNLLNDNSVPGVGTQSTFINSSYSGTVTSPLSDQYIVKHSVGGSNHDSHGSFVGNTYHSNYQSEPLSLTVNSRTSGLGTSANAVATATGTASNGISAESVGMGLGSSNALDVRENVHLTEIPSSSLFINDNTTHNVVLSSASHSTFSSCNPYQTQARNYSDASTVNSLNNIINNNDSICSNAIKSNSLELNGKTRGATNASEHITVKIDPFDVAPSMLSSRPNHNHQQNEQGIGRGDDSLAQPTVGHFLSLHNSNKISNKQSNSSIKPANKSNSNDTKGRSFNGKAAMPTLNSSAVDTNVYLTKTQTSKYSVNYPISNKTSLLVSRSSSLMSSGSGGSKKSRKPRDYYNRGKGYYGNSRFNSGARTNGLGNKSGNRSGYKGKFVSPKTSLGEPCKVEDIIDFTVGAGQRMRATNVICGAVPPLSSVTGSHGDSPGSVMTASDRMLQHSVFSNESRVPGTFVSVPNELTAVPTNSSAALLISSASNSQTQNLYTSVPIGDVASSANSPFPHEIIKNYTVALSDNNRSSSDSLCVSGAAQSTMADACEMEHSTHSTHTLSNNTIEVNVKVIKQEDKINGDNCVGSAKTIAVVTGETKVAVKLELTHGSDGDISVGDGAYLHSLNSDQFTDVATTASGVINSVSLPATATKIKAATTVVHSSCGGSSDTIGIADNNVYLCRICDFQTHYLLVFARHAPSHHWKDGHIH